MSRERRGLRQHVCRNTTSHHGTVACTPAPNPRPRPLRLHFLNHHECNPRPQPQPLPPAAPPATAAAAAAGTANGGSALLWASMLELNSLSTDPGSSTGNSSSSSGSSSEGSSGSSSGSSYRPRVITLDVNEPGLTSWAGTNTFHPVNNSLWAKYVTFIKARTCGGGERAGELCLAVVCDTLLPLSRCLPP